MSVVGREGGKEGRVRGKGRGDGRRGQSQRVQMLWGEQQSWFPGGISQAWNKGSRTLVSR